ncbi:PucR family transcriptional regulator [Ihubacter sp. rT4E-8]|uniref:PucR family transcriptional regulator n=1 Tax=Ihubacter sp. rT4E-8 TaxID=3242369 RepID=UPI003CFA99EB
MALKVKEIPGLAEKDKISLVAGKNGLERDIYSVGIVDYEFLDEFNYTMDDDFEPNCFVISSLIFAQGHPEKILHALKRIVHSGVSGLAFKKVLFQELPSEAIAFANENNFPIFAYDKDIHSEDFIFRIAEAVSKDDNQLLSEDNLLCMIQNRISNYELQKITRGISLTLKRYAMAVFITSSENMDISRILQCAYSNKHMHTKAIMAKYGNGIFLIMTGTFDDAQQFQIMAHHLLETCPIQIEKINLYLSRVHLSHEAFDHCIRESYHTYIASKASGRNFREYSKIGTYRYLIPLLESTDLKNFYEEIYSVIADKKILRETAEAFILSGGDMTAASTLCECHLNTVRYRLNKIREMTDMEDLTDFEFYECLSTAMKAHHLTLL